MNVTGDPIDERGPIEGVRKMPIHTEAPEFVEQSTAAEILVTGIKVVDLLAPYARGGKIGLFGGAGVGKTVFIQELIVRTPRSFENRPTNIHDRTTLLKRTEGIRSLLELESELVKETTCTTRCRKPALLTWRGSPKSPWSLVR